MPRSSRSCGAPALASGSSRSRGARQAARGRERGAGPRARGRALLGRRPRDVDRLREERGARPQALEAARAAGRRPSDAARDAEAPARRFGAARASPTRTVAARGDPRAGLVEARGARDAETGPRGPVGVAARRRARRGPRPARRASGRGARLPRSAEEDARPSSSRASSSTGRWPTRRRCAAIVAGERAQRVRLARSWSPRRLSCPVVAWFAWPSAGVPVYMTVSARGLRPHARPLRRDRVGARDPPTASRTRPAPARRRPRAAAGRRAPPPPLGRAAAARPRREGRGLSGPAALLKAHRRVRSADERRRRRSSPDGTRRDDAKARLAAARRRPRAVPRPRFRPGRPASPEDDEAARLLDLLVELGRVRQEQRTREEVLATRGASASPRGRGPPGPRGAAPRRPRGRTGVPAGLPLAEALLAVEAGRRKAARFRKTARARASGAARGGVRGEEAELAARDSAALDEEAARLPRTGIDERSSPVAGTPEAARRAGR